tara:strand:+ start:377 stop:739 length:363 start_codon:yes stop_codon:yes gene_type:complete
MEQLEISTINQLISTGGLIFIAIFVTLFYSRIYKKKVKLKKEIIYIKDIIYLKKVIDKYKAANLVNNVNQNYITYRSEVAEELGYKVSRQSDYSKIKERLEILQKHDRNLGYLLENISKN